HQEHMIPGAGPPHCCNGSAAGRSHRFPAARRCARRRIPDLGGASQMTKEEKMLPSRRDLLIGGAGIATASLLWRTAAAAEPDAVSVQKTDTAVVFIDPQIDVLSEKGVNWGAVGASVAENRTVENMERIFKAAKANGYEVFISPHYFYPTD